MSIRGIMDGWTPDHCGIDGDVYENARREAAKNWIENNIDGRKESLYEWLSDETLEFEYDARDIMKAIVASKNFEAAAALIPVLKEMKKIITNFEDALLTSIEEHRVIDQDTDSILEEWGCH